MLEDQVANLLQRYLGNYVRGLSKEALKISVWKGDVELTNMQLRPDALNELKLPVKVKAGFLGSVKLKVPWSRIGQDPVLVYLDRIYLLAEPATQVKGCSEDAVQEAKKSRIREMEMKLLEKAQQLNSETNKSWLGSLIDTVIGNLKLSISNVHIRYEDPESNPGHPFAAGITLEKLSAVTVDDQGWETFVTGGALDHIQKSVQLERLAFYLDSDIFPWHAAKPWVDLRPFEWDEVFGHGIKDDIIADGIVERHTYILQPVSGNAKYSKLRPNESANSDQPLQKAAVNLDDVTLCLSKDGYRDILKLADNFAAFNQRLKYAHYRPQVSVKSDPRSWWKYACKAVSQQIKMASGKLSWEHVLKYARLRKRYISLYASLLKLDLCRAVVESNKDIEELDRELDIDLILQWRMLAHKFVEHSKEFDMCFKKQKEKKSWWPFGWNESLKGENEPLNFSEEDWERLNNIIGYREGDDVQLPISHYKGDVLHTLLEVHMKHNASKLVAEGHECVTALSCEYLDCCIRLYSEAKVFNIKLGSYSLSSPNGLLAESATAFDSFVGVFCYKPFDTELDWSFVAKAAPCYMTYMKDSIDQIINFFESNLTVSQAIALETAAAVQMTIDEVKRTAQQQMNRALKDHSRFLLDLDIAAPKITVPTDFCPDNMHSTKLMLDLGKLVIRTQDDFELDSPELDMYLQFHLVLSDVSAFLVDGDYHWAQNSRKSCAILDCTSAVSFYPVIDKCGIVLKLQQIWQENPSYPTTRLSMRLPSLQFHFSPARYHRLMHIARIFQEEGGGDSKSESLHPWDQSDFEGWVSVLVWKGVGNREAVWQRRYMYLVGPFLYILEKPGAKSFKQYISLRGKHIHQVLPELVGGIERVLAVCDATRSSFKVVEDVNAIKLRCDSDDVRSAWQSRLQGAVYRASGSAPITSLSETLSDHEDLQTDAVNSNGAMDAGLQKAFIIGVLDELKICFSYSHQPDQNFMKVLLCKETRLFDFRAIGGEVELSINSNGMFIGTVLKSLEIEDLVSCNGLSQSCYLARSFIGRTDATSSFDDVGNQCLDINDGIIDATSSFVDARNLSLGVNDVAHSEGDEDFYEAPENLVDVVDCSTQFPGSIPEYSGSQWSLSSKLLSLEPPHFGQVSHLLPDDACQSKSEDIEPNDNLNSFVKAQIVIFNQSSPCYANVDKQVTVTLATLTLFCRRPTIIALMAFVNAINIADENYESFSDNSPSAILQNDVPRDHDIENQHLAIVEEPVVKGLLGKGKSRIIFNLTLNMARAQILLMKENETKLATLSQENFMTDIEVYPSSFSIKAALGNLRASDDSLDRSHIYHWMCDMRNPGGSSFVELVFNSYSFDDEDYKGYDYSLFGHLSEVRIVYLNRFIQEVVSYFMGLVPNNSNGVVKLKDQVTNSEKLFKTSDIEGSPAIKLNMSLRKPIILMPLRTESLDYLKLDVVHITVENTFQWICGREEMNAVHVEIMTILVEDIYLNVGTGTELGDSIIRDVNGISIVVRRSLRDLLHQIPSMEAVIKMVELKAACSNKEYQIILECVASNFAETPNLITPLIHNGATSSPDMIELLVPQSQSATNPRVTNEENWTSLKICVVIDLIELSLHSGVAGDESLAILQVSGAWLLYKSSTQGDGSLSATLKGFTVIDDREGIEQQFKLAIGSNLSIGHGSLHPLAVDENQQIGPGIVLKDNDVEPVPTMLIIDAKFTQLSTSVLLCIQRPQLLVALDFLLAVIEFFVPSVGSMLLNKEDENFLNMDAIILDQSTYSQRLSEFSLSPQKHLVVDDERFFHFIYDGKGGTLYLQDRQGFNLCAPSAEPIIFVGNGKKLQFKNVTIKGGRYLDSCVLLGTNSSYSASENDHVFLEGCGEGSHLNTCDGTYNLPVPSEAVDRTTELIVELQAIGPELTFYNRSKDIGESPFLSSKLLHAQFDAFCRLVMKGDHTEMSANTLGLTMESNGVRILEPLDSSVKLSSASGKTKIHLNVSDVFFNFTFSILKLFLAVEDDILAFLRMTSKKMTVVCSQFDKIGTIKNPECDQIYAFWRPRAPAGFAVLGDYLTPLDKPPTKGVLAVNTSFIRVKKPLSFRLIWPPFHPDSNADHFNVESTGTNNISDQNCSLWLPEPPSGYVALGCVASSGLQQPLLSSVFCMSASLVSPSALRDCITITCRNIYPSNLALWRVDNSVGTFLPADHTMLSLIGTAYELRHILFRVPETSAKASKSSNALATVDPLHSVPSDRSVMNSGRLFNAVASFKLIWWNQGTSSRKKLSIWRPIVSQGMVYFGDVAVQGYEPPNSCIVLHDNGHDDLIKAPLDFQFVGQIKKHRGIESISFWLPQAPPGFVSLGCIASKNIPRKHDFESLGCMRSDMVTGDQFIEECLWDTSDAKITKEPFCIWAVANDLGTFLVRNGFKKPPKRLALKLVDPNITPGSGDIAIDADIKTFSAALFDDCGGLMVPLFNISLSGVAFHLHGRSDCLNSTVNFSLAARSYNDNYDAWEPLIEPFDGFVRYQYDLSAPGAVSQLRLTSRRDLNVNISVSNVNMIFQAYASWNTFSRVNESFQKQDPMCPTDGGRSIVDIHEMRDFFVIPQNKLGQDIFVRVSNIRVLHDLLRMQPGDMRPIKVPVSKNMLDSHAKGEFCRKLRTLVTVIIADAEFPRIEGASSPQYTIAVHLYSDQYLPGDITPNQQSARTCGRWSDDSQTSGHELFSWNEIFFFKVDSLDCCMVKLTVIDMGTGDPVGIFSAPLKHIARNIEDNINSENYSNELAWFDLSSEESLNRVEVEQSVKMHGRIRGAVILSSKYGTENSEQSDRDGKKSGVIQISNTTDGPWTTMRLNYAAPAACWQFGNDIIVSEAIVKDGNRYVNIRSLVSVCNRTDFILDLCLKAKASSQNNESVSDASRLEGRQVNSSIFETEEFFETEKYNPAVGWVCCLVQPNQNSSEARSANEVMSGIEVSSGWEWIDNWKLDKGSTDTADGWVYAPELKLLKWPESYNPLKFVNYARQRRWIRTRRIILSDPTKHMSVGLVNPGDTIPLPLFGLIESGLCVFHLKPVCFNNTDEYSWSSVVNMASHLEDFVDHIDDSEICISNLSESEKLLHCPQKSGTSTDQSPGLWFCLSIQSKEMTKDIHSNPVQDWTLMVKSPLSVTNFLPMAAEFSVLGMQQRSGISECSRGMILPGKTVKLHVADIRDPLYFSLLPLSGWLPIDEVLISHPTRVPSKIISLRSSISGRIVQIILEQNFDKDQPLRAKVIRVYAACWFSISRCPPLTCRLIDSECPEKRHRISIAVLPNKKTETIHTEITEEELFDGHTVVSALNYNLLSLSMSIDHSGKGSFGPLKDLSPLGDMDGSMDLNAYDADGNCMRLFISSKPCPYQSVPTKVITIRPFITFTNRVGQNLFIKLSREDEPKVLHAFDSRVSFVYRETDGTDKLQVRLEDTEWSFPVQIVKEDTLSLVLREHNGSRKFLKTEIRGYEEGSRFIVVFRLGSTNGPIRLENRTFNRTVHIRQSGFGDDAWIHVEPLSTMLFSWEDPYGQKLIDAEINNGGSNVVWKFDIEKTGLHSAEHGMQLHVIEMGNVKTARFTETKTLGQNSNEFIWFLTPAGNWEISQVGGQLQKDTSPVEIIVEFGVVGVSVVDQKPKELCYLYLERVFISYLTGYDGGTTSRFKVILGYLQLDNQLPLTVLPVLLAPELTGGNHPVFKMTITMQNKNTDDILVFPYVYIRVTEKLWKLNIHEPIIWAFVDFYCKLQLDSLPETSSVAEVDPEIRIDLIDVSEVRLKVSLETAPAQRPSGVLGVWSPILSAIGNAFKFQVHLRKLMHRDRFIRKSSLIPAVRNRIWRDLIHNPLHLIFSLDVLGMTSSTLASLSRGFAELSTDGQFLQLRSKQVRSRRITGVGDGIIKGTEALAQGFAFGVSGVLRKPVESARQDGLLGLVHGLGQAFLGFIVQPVSGALDFVSLTVNGIGASCSRCFEIFKTTSSQRIRNPRAIHVNGILQEYCEREAIGQMILYLAETSRHFGCKEIFKEPSKYAWSDHYEDHFGVPHRRIVLVTNKRVMLLQCLALDKMDKKPCKIMWDVPWEDLLALELAKAGSLRPSHLILHLRSFKRTEIFARVIKCNVEEESEGRHPQAVQICSVVRKMWKAYKSEIKCVALRVPSSLRQVFFAWREDDGREMQTCKKSTVRLRDISSSSQPASEEKRLVKHTINFQKIWSNESEYKSRCLLCQKVSEDDRICSIWRPVCPDGYVSIGDIARVSCHPPNAAAVYHNVGQLFNFPVGFDLVWRNCQDDHASPVSIWLPRPPAGFIALGCVAVACFEEPATDLVCCVAESLAEETAFEEQRVWTVPDSYPWACHIYQVQSDALHFVALRQPKEDSEWKPIRVIDDGQPPLQPSEVQ